MSESEPNQFRRLLDDQTDWPSRYTFKFIVPKEGLQHLEKLLMGHQLSKKPSRNGNYIAVTLSPIMRSSEEVIDVYERVASIKGLVAL